MTVLTELQSMNPDSEDNHDHDVGAAAAAGMKNYSE